MSFSTNICIYIEAMNLATKIVLLFGDTVIKHQKDPSDVTDIIWNVNTKCGQTSENAEKTEAAQKKHNMCTITFLII